MWFVYMLRCSDNSLYTGITTDLNHRITVHNRGKGAKYLRSKLPLRLIYFEKLPSRSAAQSREYQLKLLPKKEKEKLILQ